MKRRIFSVCLISVFMLSMIGCSDSLNKAASASKKFSQILGEFQTNVYTFYDAKIISAENKDKIIDVCTKANQAGLQVDAILAAIKKADASAKEINLGDRERIIKILIPVSESLDPQKLEFIAGIKNESAKQKLEGGLVAARSVLSSLQIILASGGNQ